MSVQNRVFNVIKKEEKVELATQKVELSLVSDFTNQFEQLLNVQEKAGLDLIDAARKAEVRFKKAEADASNTLKTAAKLESSFKELGVDIPTVVQNKINSVKYIQKELASYSANIKKIYAMF